MSAPPGWIAVPWNSDNTPDVTAPPIEGDQPPDDNSFPPPDLPPAMTGVLFYTTTDPIMPGDDLDGFN